MCQTSQFTMVLGGLLIFLAKNPPTVSSSKRLGPDRAEVAPHKRCASSLKGNTWHQVDPNSSRTLPEILPCRFRRFSRLTSDAEGLSRVWKDPLVRSQTPEHAQKQRADPNTCFFDYSKVDLKPGCCGVLLLGT